jgi:putative ABC transport system permease protein
MFRIALRMLVGDRIKYVGLVLGTAFTAFLVTFAASYLCGILTCGFALIAENPGIDLWVMDPAVGSVEPAINMPSSALLRVRGVEGVSRAVPLALASVEARLANGAFIPVEVIAVDDDTLAGVPPARGETGPPRTALRSDRTVFVDAGGTEDKLRVPQLPADRWPRHGAHLNVPMRDFTAGDDIVINDHVLRVAAVTDTLPRFPPRPLVYMTYGNALHVLPAERTRATFIMVRAAAGVQPRELAERIAARTGLRARSSEDFKADTVRWTLNYSEDVGDMVSMVIIAAIVGLGATGVLLFMFTSDNAKHYAVLSAMGASRWLVMRMVLMQAGFCGVIGAGLGLGVAATAVHYAARAGYPVRMMWPNPLVGAAAVIVVCIVAAAISARPVLKLEPAVVFAGR